MRIIAVWMQACMHAQTQCTFPPFTQWVLVTQVGVMGWGREGEPNHENPGIVNDFSLPVTHSYFSHEEQREDHCILHCKSRIKDKRQASILKIKPFWELEREFKRSMNGLKAGQRCANLTKKEMLLYMKIRWKLYLILMFKVLWRNTSDNIYYFVEK